MPFITKGSSILGLPATGSGGGGGTPPAVEKTIDFDYELATAYHTFEDGYGDTTYFDPYQRYPMMPANGQMVMVNGTHENAKIYDPTLSSPVFPLVIQAPYGTIAPLIQAFSGQGDIFGIGYKWRFRYKNSATGEVSGLSPAAKFGRNLGKIAKETADEVVGQDVHMYLPSAGRSDVDAIQLFRNVSESETLYYLVDEKADPGTGDVFFEDNTPDADLVLGEVAELRVNPQFLEGVPPPFAKVFDHPTARLFLYGVERMGTTTAASSTWEAGQNFVTGIVGTPEALNRSRIGQRAKILKFTTGGTAIEDTTIYRIVDVDDGNTRMAVVPEIKETDEFTNGTLEDVTFEVIDDRDGRQIYMSEPNQPGQYDPRKVLTVGKDLDDGLLHIGALEGTTFAFTRRRIYQLLADFSEDPSLTARFVVVAEEGCAGLHAITQTPFGFVFANERGVRLYTGAGVPIPLGSRTAFEDFLPLTQWAGRDESLTHSVYVGYDDEEHKLHVSFAVDGGYTLERVLTFDPELGIWRGPHRKRLFGIYKTRNESGEDQTVHTDDQGNLMLAEVQFRDVVNEGDSKTVTGTITGLVTDDPKQFDDSAATFDPDDDSSVVGSPIVLVDSVGNKQVNWIARVLSDTRLQLLHVPDPVISTSFSYEIGALLWRADTAYVGGELAGALPAQELRMDRFMLRFERGKTDETFEVRASDDADGTFSLPDDGEEVSVEDEIYASPRFLDQIGRAFLYRLGGTATGGEPRITDIVAEMDVLSEGV